MQHSHIITLNNLITKTVKYKNESLIIDRFKEISTGRVVVFTHLKTLTFTYEELESFLNEIEETKPIDKQLIASGQTSKMLSGYTPSAENLEIKSSLMEMLHRVKKNPDEIPTARAVCQIADTLVNIQKSELEAIKFIKEKE